MHVKSKAEFTVSTIIVNYKAILIVRILNVIIGICLHVRASNALASSGILVDGHGLEIGITANASELGGGHRITENHVDYAAIIRFDHVKITVEGDDIVEVHEVN